MNKLRTIICFLWLNGSLFAGNIQPVLENVRNNCNGTYTALFGFNNPDGQTVTIPVGPQNRFSYNGSDYLGQPTVFPPGRSVGVFSVIFNGANCVWILDGRTSTASGGAATNSCSLLPVSPVLERVLNNCDGTYTALFGYYNPNTVAVTIPIGSTNRFSYNGISNLGQPTAFKSGRHRNCFQVKFNGSNCVWVLNGRTSTASRTAAPSCPSVNPNNIPADIRTELNLSSADERNTASVWNNVWFTNANADQTVTLDYAHVDPQLGSFCSGITVTYPRGAVASRYLPLTIIKSAAGAPVTVPDSGYHIAGNVIYTVYGAVAAGSKLTLALPLPQRYRGLPKEVFKIRHLNDNVTPPAWEQLPIDSVTAAAVHITTSSLSTFLIEAGMVICVDPACPAPGNPLQSGYTGAWANAQTSIDAALDYVTQLRYPSPDVVVDNMRWFVLVKGSALGISYKPSDNYRSCMVWPKVSLVGSLGGLENVANNESVANKPGVFRTILDGSGSTGMQVPFMRVTIRQDLAERHMHAGQIIDGFIFRNCANGALSLEADLIGQNIGDITVRNCVFDNNNGTEFSALYLLNAFNVMVERCIFLNNTASTVFPYSSIVNVSQFGGCGSGVTFNSCVFFNNQHASEDGAVVGMYHDVGPGDPNANPPVPGRQDRQLIFNNCTFHQNANQSTGPRCVYAEVEDEKPYIHLNNCIFWGNTGDGPETSTGISQTGIWMNNPQFTGRSPNGNVYPTAAAGNDGFWFTADDGLRLERISSTCRLNGDKTMRPDLDILERRGTAGCSIGYGAYFIPEWTVTATAGAGGTVAVSGVNSQNVVPDGETVTLTATPADQTFELKAWEGTNGSEVDAQNRLFVNSDKSVSARFGKIQYMLAVTGDPVEGGMVSKTVGGVATTATSFDVGTVVTLTAQPATDYTFTHWSDGGASPTLDITMDRDRTATAVFTRKSVLLTVNCGTEGEVRYNGVLVQNTVSVPSGSTPSFSLTGKTIDGRRYGVSEIKIDGVAQPLTGLDPFTCTFTAGAEVREPHTVDITFVEYVQFTYDANDNARLAQATACTPSFTSGGWAKTGSVFTLTYYPKTGYALKDYTCSNTTTSSVTGNSVSVTLNGNPASVRGNVFRTIRITTTITSGNGSFTCNTITGPDGVELRANDGCALAFADGITPIHLTFAPNTAQGYLDIKSLAVQTSSICPNGLLPTGFITCQNIGRFYDASDHAKAEDLICPRDRDEFVVYSICGESQLDFAITFIKYVYSACQ